MSSRPPGLGRLLEQATRFKESRALLTGHELGVFALLAEDPRTAPEVARSLGTDRRATEILLDALTGIGALAKEGDAYSVPGDLAPFLRSRNPGSGCCVLGHFTRHWEAWSRLTDAVRTGKPPDLAPTPSSGPDLAEAMRALAAEAAPGIAAILRGEGPRRMIDLGSGTGAYSIELLRRCPELHAVLLDGSELALRVARRDAEAASLESRMTVRNADLLHDDLGSGYDLALLFSVVCLLGEAESERLLRRVREALVPGGRVVVREYVLDETGVSPASAALFSLTMLVMTESGGVRRYADLKASLEAAGFRDVHRLPTTPMPLIVGSA